MFTNDACCEVQTWEGGSTRCTTDALGRGEKVSNSLAISLI